MWSKAVIVITAAFMAALAACSSETPLPSQVDTILADKCRTCHGESLKEGAPMHLLSWEDTLATAPTRPELKVWEAMQLRIHDSRLPMPPQGQPRLA